MKAPVGPDGAVIEIDERYIDEWIEFGWAGPKGIDELLTNHAAFATYCDAHPTSGEETS